MKNFAVFTALAVGLAFFWQQEGHTASRANNGDEFGLRLGRLAKQGRVHEPADWIRIAGLRLRDPAKWSDQPNGTQRNAIWRNPVNHAGVQEVTFSDVLAIEGKIGFRAHVELSGRPCVSVRALERGSGTRAVYNSIRFKIISLGHGSYAQGPESRAPSNEPDLFITNYRGQTVFVSMSTNGIGRDACITSLGISADRDRPMS